MRNAQSQQQTQKQGLNTFLLQQKLRVLHLMHLPALALEEYLKNQVEENPALEESMEGNKEEEEVFSNEERESSEESGKLDELAEYFEDDEVPDYKTYVNNTSKDDPFIEPVAVYYQSFQEQLKEQLRELILEPRIRSLAVYLIDSLADDGYLRIAIDNLSDDVSFAMGHLVNAEAIEEALKIIQKLEPAGIGARTLQECLLLQMQRNPNHDHSHRLAEKILSDYFSELYHKNFNKIKRETLANDEELQEALQVIGHLTPKPVFTAGNKEMSASQAIVPEFQLIKDDDRLEVSLTNNPAASISINEQFIDLLRDKKSFQRRNTEFKYFRKKVDEARWLIEALQQREETLMKIIKVIVGLQREYFLTGERINLQPMILEDVASRTGYDISTVSRVTCNKYIQTPYGNVLLKDLFSTSLHATDGRNVSAERVKQTIVEIVDHEDKSKPLTDFQLVSELNKKGFEIARRTVVKYREGLHLPNARMRKKIV